jgi:hypothetical protein
MANLSSFQRKIEGQYDLLEIGDLIKKNQINDNT